MTNTIAYMKDVTERFSGKRHSIFDLYSLNDGRSTYEALAESASLCQGQSVLDLGCGEGPLLKYVPNRNFRYVGLDLSPSAINHARKAFNDSQTEFIEADAGNMPLPDASFDRVLSHMVLHIMNPVENVISEISRILKPTGKLLFLIPAYWRMDSSQEAQRFKEIQSLFVGLKQVSHPTQPFTGKFTSEETIAEVMKQGFSPQTDLEFQNVDLIIHRPPTEALHIFICGMYNFDLIYDHHKPDAAKLFLEKLISLKDTDGLVRLRRPMAIVTVTKH